MNKNSRLLLLALGASLSLSALLRAEDPAPTAPVAPAPAPGIRHDRGDRMQKMRDHMNKELGLTTEQQAKWTEIDQQQKAAMDKLAPEDRRTKGRELMKQFDAQRRATLTPEQQAKFDDMRAKQKERMKGRGEGHDGPPPPLPDSK